MPPDFLKTPKTKSIPEFINSMQNEPTSLKVMAS